MADKTYTLTERTVVAADGKAYPVSESSGVLLGIAGQTIPYDDAVRYGLVKKATKKKPSTKAVAPDEDK